MTFVAYQLNVPILISDQEDTNLINKKVNYL